jgi:hypothetical protein
MNTTLIEEAPMRLTAYATRVDRIAVAMGLGSAAAGRHGAREPLYRITDRLHNERTVQVPAHEIAHVVSAWLAELGAHSPLVDDLARAARLGDWAAAYAVGDQLSVHVAVAA